uniref:ADAM metallopeptidase with thrombospondin type 1 motif 15 n=2 Tax=Canis lupus familiaris TaxID=9615 RepID=A0A8I3MRT7_CANLF
KFNALHQPLRAPLRRGRQRGLHRPGFEEVSPLFLEVCPSNDGACTGAVLGSGSFRGHCDEAVAAAGAAGVLQGEGPGGWGGGGVGRGEASFPTSDPAWLGERVGPGSRRTHAGRDRRNRRGAGGAGGAGAGRAARSAVPAASPRLPPPPAARRPPPASTPLPPRRVAPSAQEAGPVAPGARGAAGSGSGEGREEGRGLGRPQRRGPLIGSPSARSAASPAAAAERRPRTSRRVPAAVSVLALAEAAGRASLRKAQVGGRAPRSGRSSLPALGLLEAAGGPGAPVPGCAPPRAGPSLPSAPPCAARSHAPAGHPEPGTGRGARGRLGARAGGGGPHPPGPGHQRPPLLPGGRRGPRGAGAHFADHSVPGGLLPPPDAGCPVPGARPRHGAPGRPPAGAGRGLPGPAALLLLRGRERRAGLVRRGEPVRGAPRRVRLQGRRVCPQPAPQRQCAGGAAQRPGRTPPPAPGRPGRAPRGPHLSLRGGLGLEPRHPAGAGPVQAAGARLRGGSQPAEVRARQALRVHPALRGDAGGGGRVHGQVPRRRPGALPADAAGHGGAPLPPSEHPQPHQRRRGQGAASRRPRRGAQGHGQRGPDAAQLLRLAEKAEQSERQAPGVLGHGHPLHQAGHVFNMPHDNVKVCEEVFGKLRANHMMSPTLIQIDRANPWSACSAAIITDFLDSGHGDCLLDAPSKPISLPEDLPGASYTLSQQCELAFGVGSKPCPYMQYCTKLWCTGKAKGQMVCQTRHFPWADGTSCGDGKFCLKGTCVERHNLNKYRVDGFWAKWEPYGACSRTCGGGVQLARRQCSNPTPANGGKYCEGVRVKYRSCNLEPCPSSASGKSFREEQCEAFNGYNHSTNRLTLAVAWVPKYSGVSPQDKCKLICRANGTGYFYVLAPKVVDGTPCTPDSTSVCVQGKCIKAGCDGNLGSKKKFDKCGVCGGDNKSCKKVTGLFTKPMHGYNFVVAIPAGASSIDIRQRGYKGLIGDDNYLALKNSQGKYLLNGHFVVSAVERDLVVKGSLLRYSGTGTAVESLQASRPILEPLTVEVLSVGKMTPPRVRYSFYLPKEPREDRAPAEPRGAPGLLDGAPGLSNQVEPQGPRAAGRWVAGGWGPCSASCGGGGLQRRPVDCRGPAGPRPPSACRPAPRPADTRACGEPCASWQPGAWSPCSKSCGRGFKRRALQCLGPGGRLLARDRCDLRRKPQELDFCAARPC